VERVLREGADLGVAYDGDADRPSAWSVTRAICGATSCSSCFRARCSRSIRGASIIFEVKCSQTLVDDIARPRRSPVMWRTGILLSRKMKEENRPLAGR